MRLLLSDLDNTLIYSYKRDIGADKVLVETKDGKELSFMSCAAHRMLRGAVKKFCFVPVTTRSLEQYRRIIFMDGWQPELALVSNGGHLLRRGEIDRGWYAESLRLASEAEEELCAAERMLASDPAVSFEVRRVDGLFVFTKSDDPEGTVLRLAGGLDPRLTEIYQNGTKVYALPRALGKGAAVRRLRALLDAEEVFAAGDSKFDLTMLLSADRIWIPQELSADLPPSFSGRAELVEEGELLSDRFLAGALQDEISRDAHKAASRHNENRADAEPAHQPE